MFNNIVDSISSKINEQISNSISNLVIKKINSDTKRNPRPSYNSIKEEMIFEVDEAKLSELQKQLDEEFDMEPTEYNFINYPERFI